MMTIQAHEENNAMKAYALKKLKVDQTDDGQVHCYNKTTVAIELGRLYPDIQPERISTAVNSAVRQLRGTKTA